MTERVKLFPGVTVPRSIALAVEYGTIEDRIDHDAAPWSESPDGLGSIGPEAADTVEDVVRFLEKERARMRIRNEFGQRKYHWLRDMAPDRHKEPSRRPMTPLEVEFGAYEREMPATNGHLGVNAILDYIGIPDGGKRNEFLSQFNRDIFYGVDAVRTAFHTAQFYGLMQHYEGPEDREKNILRAMIQSVGINGTRLTDAVIEKFGIESLPKIVADYSPLKINGLLSLVPTSDLGNIISAMEDPALHGLRAIELMRVLGYEPIRAGRTPILYSPVNRQL